MLRVRCRFPAPRVIRDVVRSRGPDWEFANEFKPLMSCRCSSEQCMMAHYTFHYISNLKTKSRVDSFCCGLDIDARVFSMVTSFCSTSGGC